MNQQRTRHQMQAWETEDYAAQAQRSAQSAQTYHRVTTQAASAIEAELDAHAQEIRLLKRQIQGLKSDSQDPQSAGRTAGILWGAGSAIVSAIVISLMLAPNTQPAPIQRNVNTYQQGK